MSPSLIPRKTQIATQMTGKKGTMTLEMAAAEVVEGKNDSGIRLFCDNPSDIASAPF